MPIDMTKLARLGSVGLAKVLTMIPRGQAEEGVQFAFKIKKARWAKSDYGYRYHLDVVVRTLDMQAVLGSELWKVYPSLLPQETIEAIDTDCYDDTWWLVYTESNPKSKADPKKTILHLIDTQQGLDAHSGPPKATEGEAPEAPASDTVTDAKPSPSPPCPHEHTTHITGDAAIILMSEEGFYCTECRERVG